MWSALGYCLMYKELYSIFIMHFSKLPGGIRQPVPYMSLKISLLGICCYIVKMVKFSLGAWVEEKRRDVATLCIYLGLDDGFLQGFFLLFWICSVIVQKTWIWVLQDHIAGLNQEHCSTSLCISCHQFHFFFALISRLFSYSPKQK